MAKPTAITLGMGLALGFAITGCATTGGMGPADPCDGFEREIDEIWGPSDRRGVRDALEAFAGESQGANINRITTKMDALTTDWVTLSRSACKDAKVRGTMPKEVHVRATLCLDTALTQQRTLIKQLEKVDRTSYEHIDRAMLEISEHIATCNNQAVLAYYRAPEETANPEAAKTADEGTATAQTLVALGGTAAASGMLTAASKAAKQSGDERRVLDAGVARCNHLLLLGEYDDAVEVGESALAQAQKLGYAIGEAEVLTCVGTAELGRGKHVAARERLEAALAQREAFFGADHPQVADAANRLGSLDAAVANYHSAHELYMRALKIWTKAFGPDDPITSRAYHNLGLTHVGLDDINGAVAWYQQAIEAETKSLGADHPSTALTEADYASVLILKDKVDEAYELLNHAVEVQELILGPGHPDIAVSYHGIGDVWAARKGYDEALRWYQKALVLRQLALGERHLKTAHTLDVMGIAYFRLKKYDEAIDHLTQAMQMREQLVGSDNILTATSYFNLGVVYEKRKKYGDALSWYEKALVVEDAVRGEGHVMTKETHAAVSRLRDKVR